MNKIEEIEELERGWKAAEETTNREDGPIYWEHCHAQSLALCAALGIIKRPSNTAMQIDTEPCVNCNFYKTNVRFRFCPDCGLALSD